MDRSGHDATPWRLRSTAFTERVATGDFDHQGREAIILLCEPLYDCIDGAAVLRHKSAAEGEREHFFGQAAGELVLPRLEHLGQFTVTGKSLSAGQFARSIDRLLAFLVSP